MTTQAACPSLEIANRILDIGDENKIKLTVMQLLKVLYFAHGWHLAFTEKPLTRDLPEVWRYGPVYVAVYDAFRHFGADHITKRATTEEVGVNKDTNKLLKSVVTAYGEIHAYELSNMTHTYGSPWSSTLRSSGLYSKISNKTIKAYFDELKRQSD